MPAHHHLKPLLDRRTRALSRHLPRAVAGEARGVHQARVASRRLREAVPVITAGVTGAKRRSTVRMLRRLTRSLGLVREMDVSLAALAEGRRAAVDRDAVDLVASHLQRLRSARREEMLARLAAIDRPALAGRLRRLGALASAPDVEPAWRAALARRLTRRAGALVDAVNEAGALFVPARLHLVRIAAKKLRYALELADEARAADTGAMVRRLKQTQDTLGRLHDLQVLIEHVRTVRLDAAVPRTVPPARLDDLTRVFETECRALHGRYVAAAVGLAALAGEVTGRVAPSVAARPGTGRPAPLKMTLDAPGRRRVQR